MLATNFLITLILFLILPAASGQIYLLQESDLQSRTVIWKGFNENVVAGRQTTRAAGLAGYLAPLQIVYDIRYFELKDDKGSGYKTKQHDIKVQNFYRDFDINESWSVRIGKFVENWQLGYEFNPLAVVDPYRENSSLSNPLDNKTGLHAIAVNYVGDSSTTTFYLGDDNVKKDIITNKGNRYIAIKYNRAISNDTDITAVSQKKQRGRIGVGAGFRHMVNDALQIHGSAFIRQGTGLGIHEGVYDNNASYIATSNPIGQYRLRDSVLYPRLMLGMQYTTLSDINVIIEFGYDKRKMDERQWRTYKNMVNNHVAITDRSMLPAKMPNIVWDMSIITPEGIRQKYIMGRISKAFADIELNSFVRMGVDKCALWRNEIKYISKQKFTTGAYFITTLGRGDSEYGKYFINKNSLNIYFRKDF